MFHRNHRYDHKAPIGVVLGKLVLGIAGAIIKKKIADRLASKKPPHDPEPHTGSHGHGSRVRRCSPA